MGRRTVGRRSAINGASGVTVTAYLPEDRHRTGMGGGIAHRTSLGPP